MINPIEIKLALLNNRMGLTPIELKEKIQLNTGHYPAPNEFQKAIDRCKQLGTIESKNGKYYSINKRNYHVNKLRRNH